MTTFYSFQIVAYIWNEAQVLRRLFLISHPHCKIEKELHFLFFLMFISYWKIVDQQCCASFRYKTESFFQFFFRFFSYLDYYRILSRFHCAIQQVLLVICFTYNSVSVVSLLPSPLGNHSFLLQVCEFASVLEIISFVSFLRFCI